jgi:hypothetical protein
MSRNKNPMKGETGVDGAQPTGKPESKTDNVIVAERMVDELVQSMSAMRLSKECKVNYITISKISKGDSSRISERVFKSIVDFYNGFKAGEIALDGTSGARRAPRKAVEKKAVSPALTPMLATHDSIINTELIQSEIERTKNRLDILNRMLELANQL